MQLRTKLGAKNPIFTGAAFYKNCAFQETKLFSGANGDKTLIKLQTAETKEQHEYPTKHFQNREKAENQRFNKSSAPAS